MLHRLQKRFTHQLDVRCKDNCNLNVNEFKICLLFYVSVSNLMLVITFVF